MQPPVPREAVMDDTVYCLDVETNHNFFADGVLVHNCQDLNPLQWALIEQWAQHAERLVLAGDPAQAIYTHVGARPDELLTPLPADQRALLGKERSYRLPRAVHAFAEDYLRREHSPAIMEGRDWKPRDADGDVRRVGGAWQDGEAIAAHAVHAAQDGTVMVLATCAYMLGPTISVLRDSGEPFHNPYRRPNPQWNPLHRSRNRYQRADDADIGTSTIDRLRAFLSEEWTWAQAWRWLEMLSAQGERGIWQRRGLRADFVEMVERAGRAPITIDDLRVGLTDAALEAVRGRDLRWLVASATQRYQAPLRYGAAVVRRHGPQGLTQEPKIMVGTNHCSPPDELILTKRGQVPIAELVLGFDRVVGYHRPTNTILGSEAHKSSRGYDFQRSEQPYSGPLIVLTTPLSQTRVTPNHRVLVKFDDDAFCGRWVVYLMRRNDWWRIGICVSAHRPYRAGGVAARLSTEQGDAAWILAVCESRREALMMEGMLQAKYGIPGLTFQSAKARALNDEDLHVVHTASASWVGVRAHAALADLGMSPSWPLYRRGVDESGNGKRNMRGWFETEAANLVCLSNRVCMAVYTGGRKAVPARASVTSVPYDGPVFGLEVSPHHRYLSGNAVVHNSVKGGEGMTVIQIPEISRAAYVDGFKPGGHDANTRTLYVGLTRARERLWITGMSRAGYSAGV